MKRVSVPLASLALALAAAPASAEGDAAAGKALAEEHCARCHDVSAEGAFKTYPPSFASIAAFRPTEQIYSRIVFPVTHSGMPDTAFYMLSRGEVDDVVAYIESLERP